MADKEISLIIRAKDAASAVFKKLNGEINGISFSFKKLDATFHNFNKLGEGFVNAGTKMFLTGGGIVAGFGLAIKKASDFNEIQEKFNGVMKLSSSEAEGFAKNLVDSFGMSEAEAKKSLGNMGDILNGIGAESPQVAKLSNEFVKFAADMAEFKKVDISEVLQRMQKALTGQLKGLKGYGLVLSEADIKQEALSKGLIKSGQEMSSTARASALLSLMMKKVPEAIGQTQRSWNDLDAQMVRVKNRFEDIITNIGSALIPMLENLIKKLEPSINSFVKFANENQSVIQSLSKFGIGVGLALSGLGLFNIAIGTAFKSVGFAFKGFELWNRALIGTRIQLFLLPLEALRMQSVAFAATINTVMVASLVLLAVKINEAVDEWIAYKKAQQDAVISNAQYQEAVLATVKDVADFNKQTGNQAQSIVEVSRLAREQGLILSNQTGKWEAINKKVVEQKSTVTILGAVYKQLKEAASSALDSTKSKIDELDKKLKESQFQKLATADKFAKISQDIANQALEAKGDNLAVWENKFTEATKLSREAADLIQKASTEKDQTIKENLVKLIKEKIDSGLTLTQSITGAVTKTDASGNEVILQTLDQSQEKAIGLISVFKKVSENLDSFTTTDLSNEKNVLEQKRLELQTFFDSIPENIDTKVNVEINKTTYDNAVKLIESLTKKTLKFNITPETSNTTQDQPEGFARGGALPGYGGGDRINAVLEAGEYVVRKEAVKKFGSRFFAALNDLNLPGRIKAKYGGMIGDFEMPEFSLPRMAFAAGGQVPQLKSMGTLDLTVRGRTYPVMGNINVIEELKQQIQREKMMRAT